MLKEIGSNFWLNPEEIYDDSKIDLSHYGLKGNDSVLLSTGRAAEQYVLRTVEERNSQLKKVALIPPFTCQTVIEPFRQLGYCIWTYPIDEKLCIKLEQFRRILDKSQAQVVLLHRYFGFDTLKEMESIICEYQAKGVSFIEDRTQNLYSDHPELNTDYTIGSLRKWSGVLDGAFALCREGKFRKKPSQYDEDLKKEKMEACYLKYRYMMGLENNKEEYLLRYRRAEEILDKQQEFYRICPESERIQASLDNETLKVCRRKNYSHLYLGLKEIKPIYALTPELSEGDVPLYLAITLENRGELQKRLKSENIFAPVVWPLPDNLPFVCDEARDFYQHILCFPVDQRYGLDDMERIIRVIKKELEYGD